MPAATYPRPTNPSAARTWAATFHPELTDDDRLMRAWLAD